MTQTEHVEAQIPPPPPVVPPDRRGRYLLAVAASWALPGAGHWLLGYRVRGVALCVLILGIFWIGQLAADFRAISREIHPVFFCAQAGSGVSALVCDRVWGDQPPYNEGVDPTVSPHHNTGILFTSISGLLNMLLVLFVADPRTWSARRLEEEGETKAAGAGAEQRSGGAE
jgi:hypothetical protein